MSESIELKLLSLNVRGLRNQRKRRSTFAYLKDQNCAVYLLQETFSQPQDELICKTEWRGEIFFSHVSNHQNGVFILLNLLFDIKIENSWGDQDGRIVLINAYFKAFKFSLCNIYAPNNPALQELFIESLGEILISKAEVSNLIVGGDWNVTLGAIDKKGGIQWKPTPYRNLVVGLMNELNLDDILRTKNPDKKCFTYESKALKIKSRIDFFLIAKPLTIRTKTADIRTAIAPDHKAIRLSLQTDSKKKGPGLWKFNIRY